MPKREHLKALLEALADLATRRQSRVDESTLKVYAADLQVHRLEDVREALIQLGREPKQDYQPSFPALGDILNRVGNVKAIRLRAAKYVPCSKCSENHPGKVFVNKRGEPWNSEGDKERFAADCECLTAWKEAQLIE